MATNAEIKALIETRVRAQRSHILHDGVAEILDFMVDNIAAGPGGTPGIDDVLAVGQLLTADRELHLNGHAYSFESEEDRYALWVEHVGGGATSYMEAFSNTLGGNLSRSYHNAGTEQAYVYMQASFDDEDKLASIKCSALSTVANIEHDADKHTFVRGVDEFADNAAALTALLEPGTLYYRTGHGLDIVRP